MWRLPALGRSSFIHELGGQNSDHQASPVGDGVAKKRAPVGIGIGVDVERNPAEQNDNGGNAQRVAVEEGACSVLFHEDSMMIVANQVGQFTILRLVD